MERKLGDEKRLLEKVMTWVPGFRGYKEKEIRRESDKMIRTLIHEKMETLRKQILQVYRGIVDEGMTEMWEGIDRILARTDRLSERINHAAYGYTGFFDLVKIDEKKLDRMMDFDYKLIEKAESLNGKIEILSEALKQKEKEKLKKEMISFSEELDNLEESFDKRKSVILGLLEG